MKKRLTLSAGVRIQAAAGAEKRRRFSIVAYTGSALDLPNFDLPLYIELSSLYWNGDRRPCLYNHEQDKDHLVGQLDDIRVEAGALKVDGFFLRSTQIGRDVQAIAEDGYEWQASVGALPEELEEVPEGHTAEVNGQTVSGPCYIARRTCLGEVSFVVMGADDRTSARITARLSRARRIRAQAKGIAAMTFEEWLASLGLEGLTDEQKTALRVEYDKLYPATDVEAEDDEEEVEAEGDEEDVEAADDEEEQPAPARSKAKARGKKLLAGGAIKALGNVSSAAKSRARELKRMAIIAKVCQGYPSIEAQALEKGWTVDKTRLEVLRASRPSAPSTRQGGGRDRSKVIEAALLLTAGTPEDKVGKHFDQQTMNQAMERDMRGVSLHFLMDSVIEASGDHFRGNRKSEAFIKAAMRAERMIRANSGFTTLSLGTILENVAHKALIASYEAVETIWQEFCGIRTHNDFKVHSRYRLDAQGAFRKVGPDGELKHVGMSDAKYSNQLETFGAIISLTRQMKYNDDLGAFLEIPRMLGEMGALAVEEAFVVLVLANTGNFFHADNRNLASGAFSIAGLSALEQKFRDQIGPNGKPVLVSPTKLLVPTTLKVEADNVYEETMVNETTTTDKAKPARNPHKGKYKPYTSPYLNNTAIRVLDGKDQPTAISGQSATAYYLFADPASRAAFGMSFLNGQQTPIVETSDSDFNTLGDQWRAYFDFGVGQEDPTFAAKSSGT